MEDEWLTKVMQVVVARTRKSGRVMTQTSPCAMTMRRLFNTPDDAEGNEPVTARRE